MSKAYNRQTLLKLMKEKGIGFSDVGYRRKGGEKEFHWIKEMNALLDSEGFFSLASVMNEVLMNVEYDNIVGIGHNSIPFILARYLDCFNDRGCIMTSHPQNNYIETTEFVGGMPDKGARILLCKSLVVDPVGFNLYFNVLEKLGCKIVQVLSLADMTYEPFELKYPYTAWLFVMGSVSR